ncbi:hypothetical protein EGR_11072 [Echinococcus granulosus]|uniref:Uncharacterized protein n=1 Tax=Echinococcus granulosus TaxID=6210 RepID=W6UKP9_ECHGR|nr:hypothetical protein EGR_11072 [Echinococcus granulosus]EUB54069.1 hypothetical protein EGR_11072 [Echinococcus granulosus]
MSYEDVDAHAVRILPQCRISLFGLPPTPLFPTNLTLHPLLGSFADSDHPVSWAVSHPASQPASQRVEQTAILPR